MFLPLFLKVLPDLFFFIQFLNHTAGALHPSWRVQIWPWEEQTKHISATNLPPTLFGRMFWQIHVFKLTNLVFFPDPVV